MGRTFFTSDPHLNHDKDFVWKARGFNSIEEHNEAIVKNWNETVAPDDEVHVVGDIMVGENQDIAMEYLSRLNGKIYMTRGNHDSDSKVKKYLSLPNFDSEQTDLDTYSRMVKVGKWRFYCCHWATRIGDFMHARSSERRICLHGHTHSKDKFQFIEDCCYNVAMDAHNNRPVSAEEIQNDIREYLQKLNNEKMKERKNASEG